MKWSLSLGRISGIEVFVHWTFLILIGWILFSHINMGHGWEQSLVGVLFILVLFACVLLHELGHALTGKRYCPMAFDNKGAYWLTEGHEIRNPYFGDTMLKCGEITEIIP